MPAWSCPVLVGKKTNDNVLFSGAGKTTLLNILSRQNMSHLQLSGTVMVNNHVIKDKIKFISAYVQQEDLFIGTLTVKEHLTFQVSIF